MFVELRAKTVFSFLSAASTPEQVVAAAVDSAYSAVGIVDQNGVYGIPRAYAASKSFPFLKLIVGAELTLDQGSVTLLAKTRKGYANLCRLITEAHCGDSRVLDDGLRQKGTVGLSWSHFLDRPKDDLFFLLNEEILSEGEQRAQEQGKALRAQGYEVFLPVPRLCDGWDRSRLKRAWVLEREHGFKIVASQGPRFHCQKKRPLLDFLTGIKHNTKVDELGFRLLSNRERTFKPVQEMVRIWQDYPIACSRTLEIAEQCTFHLSELRYTYPSEWIPEGVSAQVYLTDLVMKGALWRYRVDTVHGIPQDVRSQLDHELRLISELQFADYFLTVWDLVEFARSQNILCQGRGSAANSVVCYCLGITAIDPVRMNLLFERFISVERGEPPDIDVDFEHERREEVIQYIYQKYGRDRAAMVSAVITYRTRSTLRDLDRILGVRGDAAKDHPLFHEIRGLPRHLSIHSGGFTLSAHPIVETVPVEPARMPGRTIVQWDKEDLAIIGLLKIDVLALGMLTAIQKSFQFIAETTGPVLSLATVPPEDPKTYAMMRRADTIGVFQIESRAQMSMLGRLEPETFYDLVVEVAIVRPGPIVGQMVHPYLKRRRGLEPVDIPHPKLIPILSRTLGVPLFQEQVMKMAVVLAGFSAGEADQLRRAIGAWRSSGQVEKFGMKLREGLLSEGLPVEFVDRVFKQVQGFAEYGFPESHAASFALLAYASSYLKCHFPAAFTCALLNSQPMGFYSNHTLIEDAVRHGVKVLPVSVNHSEWDSRLLKCGKQIRLGFRVVRGISKKDVDRMIFNRGQKPFEGVRDFLWRSRFSARILLALAQGDTFKEFGIRAREAMWMVLAFLGQREGVGGSEASGVQLSLFEGCASDLLAETVSWEPRSALEAIQSDYQSFGVSTKGHPMLAVRKQIFSQRDAKGLRLTSAELKALPGGRKVQVVGLVIVRQRPPTAKGTAFATLEDEAGFLDLIIHAPVQKRCEEAFLEGTFWKVRGTLQKDRATTQVVVDHLEHFEVFDSVKVPSYDFR